jgi:hypothetical protein
MPVDGPDGRPTISPSPFREGGKGMQVSIGDITARCRGCGGTDFESSSAGALRLSTELKCTQCGAKVRYLSVLDQIGEEAMRRANQAIDELKKRPPRK